VYPRLVWNLQTSAKMHVYHGQGPGSVPSTKTYIHTLVNHKVVSLTLDITRISYFKLVWWLFLFFLFVCVILLISATR
jgi:hypothetical protein